MAGDSDMEKTEEPSQRRLDDAREKGNVTHSKELVTVGVFFAGFIFFTFMNEEIQNSMANIMKTFLSFDQFMNLNSKNIGTLFFNILLMVVPILFPLFALIFFMAIAANVGQIGFMMSSEKLTPDLNKLNPIKGFGKIFAFKNVAEGIKTFIKFAIVGYIGYITLKKEITTIIQLSDASPGYLLSFTIHLGLKIAFRVALIMIFFSGFDYLYQRYEFRKSLMMTKQEMKDEIKEREGNPLIKQRVRSIQMEMARKRMMTEVPTANVVITNPTHFAVAIKYDITKMAAPVVVAKGADIIAQKIKEIAIENSVPIVENPLVARALFKTVKIGRPIPPTLFKAVAEILAYIYKISKSKKLFGMALK